jgi:flagellar hook protein FlgE
MSFNTGLSGLNAASKDLNVIGNNIANADSTGFKSSRTEFADIYSTSILGTGSNATGSGVVTSSVSQQFTQGTITETGNSLDLAIDGNGFFVLSNNGAITYTRNGTFNTDSDGYVVDSAGNRLQGYGLDGDGNIQTEVLTDLVIESGNQEPLATSEVTQNLALDSTDDVPTNTTFDASDADTYNWSTSVEIFDTQGNAHVMSEYFVKDSSNNWTMYVTIDGRNPSDPTSTTPYSATVTFDSSGNLSSTASSDFTVDADTYTLTLNDWVPAAEVDGVWGSNGAAASTDGVALDITGSTQTNTSYAVNSVSQDGYTTGQLSGVSVGEDGILYATYTNDRSTAIGQVVLATFSNSQGLTPVGNSNWAQSSASGEPAYGVPGSGTKGTLTAGALEDSNVDLTSELVGLIEAQRNYQANAKTIEIESSITETIINIR